MHPIKGGKGGKGDQFPALGGKGSGKSTNRPKEPTPLPKQGGAIQLSKSIVGPPVPLVLHKPPAKAGEIISVVKHPATPKAGAESTGAVEPVPKTDSVFEQPKAKGEAEVSAEQPKPKGKVHQSNSLRLKPRLQSSSHHLRKK